MPFLKTDVCGVRAGTIYGKAGDEVKIIADHIGVLIVESLNGNRFAAKRDEVTEVVEEIGKSTVRPIVTVETKKGKKSTPKNIQKDLF